MMITNILNEILKLFVISFFIIKKVIGAIFFNSSESKLFLSKIYQTYLSSKSKIKTIELNVFEHISFVISSNIFLDYNRPVHKRFSLLNPQDLYSILFLLKKNQVNKIFEFGVMNGSTLWHFYNNTSSTVTIDSIEFDTSNIDPMVLELIKDDNRITIHNINSNQFDALPYKGIIDFILIDGGHDYQTIKSDSEKAFQMLRSNGIIVWDDYNPSHAGVYKYINELARYNNNIFHIKNTKLAYYTNSSL